MAEKKSIHEFQTGTPQAQTAFVVDTPNASAESGYITEKVITSDLGNTLLGTLNYTQSLDTESKNIFGAVNELNENKVGKSELSAWDDITSSVTPTNYITDFVYRINRMTGLKYVAFTIKPGTPDSTVLISPLPNVNFKKITPIPIAMANAESIGLGNFSCYFYPDGNVIFRCKTPTTTSSLFVVGFLL